MSCPKHSLYSPYGASEMKATYQKNLMLAMSLVLGLITLTVLSGYAVAALIGKPSVGPGPGTGPPADTTIISHDWVPPPPIEFDDPPRGTGRVGPGESPLRDYVVPEPVDDTLLHDDSEYLLPTNLDRREGVDGLYTGDGDIDGGPGGPRGGGGTFVGDVPGPGVFRSLEVQPEMIYEEHPEYPRLAEMAGMEGSVWIHALVTTEGKVIEARVARSSGVDSLDEAAVAAAYKNRFSPAIQNSHPVVCWVTYEVRFVLESTG